MACKRCIYDRNIECNDYQKCDSNIKRSAKIQFKLKCSTCEEVVAGIKG